MEGLLHGLFVGLIGISITFIVMVVLIFCINLNKNIFAFISGENKKKTSVNKEKEEDGTAVTDPKVIAAISAAVNCYYAENVSATYKRTEFVVRSIRKRI